MSLPTNEYFPEDPDLLPPARRRRARRLLAPLAADERAATLDHMARRTSPTFDFFLFSALAGLLFSLGLLADSPPLLVLAAVFAPLLAPVVGVSLGTVTGSYRLFASSLVGLLVGSLLVFLMGLLVGLPVHLIEGLYLEQAIRHTQLSWPMFVLMAAGAVFTAALMTHAGRSAAAPSVALAYTLYLPLAAAGMGLSSGMPHLWPDGLVLFAIHLAWAILFGALTLALRGFRPLTLFGYTLGGVVTLAGVILLVAFGAFSATLGVFGAPVARPTYTPTATLTATPIPPTITPTLTPVPPTATSTATFTPTLAPTVTLTPSPTPMPVYARIAASKESGGAFVRTDPGFDSTSFTTVTNNTLVEVLPDSVVVDGYTWAHIIVVDSGLEGWILQDLLAISTPVPQW